MQGLLDGSTSAMFAVRWQLQLFCKVGFVSGFCVCKVGFVSGFCVPCNVLKIALGRVDKVMDVCICAGC